MLRHEHQLRRGENGREDHSDGHAHHDVEAGSERSSRTLVRKPVGRRQSQRRDRRNKARGHSGRVRAVYGADDGADERAAATTMASDRLIRVPPEAVADTPYGLNPVRVRGVGLDLGSQAADVDRHGCGVAVEGELPDAVHQLIAAEDLARVAGEEEQEVELSCGQVHLSPADDNRPCRRIDLEVAEAERLLRVTAAIGAAQHGVHARHQLSGENGLTT